MVPSDPAPLAMNTWNQGDDITGRSARTTSIGAACCCPTARRCGFTRVARAKAACSPP